MGQFLTQNIRNLIGSNLKRIREKKELTQVEVAERAGINPQYYPRIERGEINITIDKLYKIIKALRIRSSDILPF